MIIPMMIFIHALIGAESGNPDFHLTGQIIIVEARVGTRGEWGPLQITTQLVDDVNRISPAGHYRYTYLDRLSEDKAIEMCIIYLMHYGTPQHLGHIATEEDLARMWNGGPDGWKKKATRDYWRKRVEPRVRWYKALQLQLGN